MERRPTRERRPYTTGDPKVDAQLAALVQGAGDAIDRQLLSELLTSVYRLEVDRASTGDLKLLNSAIKELRYAFNVFQPYRQVRKVATFGSARVSDSHPAYGMAKEFGRLMAKAGWMVITGAASGIMKAGHEGAGSQASFGLNIRLPFEQEANTVIAGSRKLINCKYFFTRKLLFIKESHATALFAGGFGTLDEGFETLTLVQTGKTDPRPIVFVDAPGDDYWRPLLKYMEGRMVRDGMIAKMDTSIYQVASSAKEAADVILRFYSNYHSLRYVGNRLVLRVQRAVPQAALDKLTREFPGLVTSGRLMASKPLPEEADEPELAHLSRVVFHFNRQHFGPLVQLIHRLNDLGAS